MRRILQHKIASMLIGLGLFMVIAGSVVIYWTIRQQATNIGIAPPTSHVSTQASKTTPSVPTISGDPADISIPSLSINLPIVPGTYNTRTKQWTLTLDKVQYATMTPEPNNVSGNTFLYGHYRANVFASLHKISANAQAIITTTNGHTFYYTLSGVTVVSPYDSAAVFGYTGSPILTVQTCTGLFFQNRQLFIFNLVKAT